MFSRRYIYFNCIMSIIYVERHFFQNKFRLASWKPIRINWIIMKWMHQRYILKPLKARGVNTCTHICDSRNTYHVQIWMSMCCTLYAHSHWACAKTKKKRKEKKEQWQKKIVDGRQIMSTSCVCINEVLTNSSLSH